ncbi:MAG: hypothetical protein EP344_15630 [Bacteroidetes bacterium]|nr:MAG: hypothetical protein EP344_15630 [Bacteroidota bacterium]
MAGSDLTAMRTALSGIWKRRSGKLWLVLFSAAALLLYWPTRNAGFVMDWLGWQYAYNKGGWAGVPGSFGYPGLHPVLHLGNYTLYWLFGANSPVWYLCFALLHGLNAGLLFRLVQRLPLQVPPGQQLYSGLVAGVLFLVSPYAAEVVVWRVCLHYLLAMTFALLALHQTLSYLNDQKRHRLWWVHGLVFVGLFTFEWSLVIPVLVLLLVLVYSFSGNTTLALPKALVRIFLPQAGMWVMYFLLNKIRLGDWVGHYGSDTHLNVQPRFMLANILRYVVKQFGFARHWDHAAKSQVFEALGSGWPLLLGVGILGVLAAGWLLRFRQVSPRLQWAGAAAGWFLIALLPVSNLFFYYLQFSENDRYGYFASGFGWISVALLLSFLPKIPARLLAIGSIALSLHLLLGMNRYWTYSEDLYDSLVQDFRWYDRDEVIILASPDNYKGVFMFRIIGQLNGFNEALELRRGKPFKGKMWEAAQFNINEPNYRLAVEPDSAGLLYKVQFMQDGNWWWQNGVGATDYSTDRYVFRNKDWHMEVELNGKSSKTTVIYPCGGQWFEVK